MIQKTVTIGEAAYGYVSISTASMEILSGWEVYNNGVRVLDANITVSREDPNGYFILKFIPAATGNYFIDMYGAEVLHVEVVNKTIYTMIKNIEDEALGSWSWDKTTGELNLLKQDGTPLASFDVTDTQLTASRERTA